MRLLVPALLAVACSNVAAAAQHVAGRLHHAAPDTAYGQTYVLLLDSAGGEVGRSVTDANGRFEFLSPMPGRYQIQAERIGFASLPTSVSIDGPVGDLNIDPGFEAIILPGPSGQAPACQRVGEGPATHYWTEIRKALGAVLATARRRELRFEIRVFERELGLDGTIRREEDSVLADAREIPFAAASAAAAYVTRNPAGALSYFAPDPVMLLDPAFEHDHCFQVVSDPRRGVGLAYRSLATPADIEGTFWVDPQTGELQQLDFRYAAQNDDVDSAVTAGSARFVAASPTDWIIAHWDLRLPVVFVPQDTGTSRIVGVTSVGTRTLVARRPGGLPIFADQRVAVLQGAIHDSVTNTPLEGAVAALAGTNQWVTTDDDGQFFLAGHFDGRYRVVFGHPRLDSLGFVATPFEVELHRGAEAIVQLGVPPLDRILEAQCGPRADEGMRILAGVVRDAATNRPVQGAVVSVTREMVPVHLRHFASSSTSRTAVTDSLGRYALCGVPPGQKVTVTASTAQRASDFVTVEFEQDSIQIGGRATMALTYPVARLDLPILESEFHTGQISGYVVEELTGRPIPDATVSIDGTRYATDTDSAGAFTLAGTPSGEVGISIRRLGYQMLRHNVSVTPGAVAVLSSNVLRMRAANSEAYELDPITVEARRAAVHATTGFEERRNVGRGSFLTREQFEDWHPTQATDVLRRMRGIRVIPNTFYGVNGDTRRFVIVPSRDIGQRVTQVITTNAERALTNLGAGEFTINECPVLLFLDGVFMGNSRTSNVDNFISIASLGAVEVYSPSQVPARFALPGSTCGVALFWTR